LLLLHPSALLEQAHRQVGPRILTFYLYLNDVASGGETEFPRLGLKVAPKRGRAVLWPSVLNSHPNHIDSRSDHQALPVLEGIKYGANAWIHQRDYKSDDTDGVCT
jgi:prolyl 4-hydroxylase